MLNQQKFLAVSIIAGLLNTQFIFANTIQDGVYIGKGAGYGGDIPVKVKITEGKIENIKFEKHNETFFLSDPSFKEIPEEMIKYQTYAVDTVAGSTATSRGIIAAVRNALRSSGANIESFSKKPQKEIIVYEKIMETADIVIIGGGGAGMAAAVEARKAGKSVIVLEKLPQVGGNTLLAGSAYNAVDPEAQSKQGIEDSIDLHFKHTYEGGDKVADPKLVRILVENALEGKKYLSNLGAEWLEKVNAAVGATWQRSYTPNTKKFGPRGASFILPSYEEAKKTGSTIMVDSKAEELIMENGRVVGVKGKKRNGQEFEIRANNGVIIATGGFSANIDMRQKYNKHWANLSEDIPTSNHSGATGDGIILAEKAGAQLVGMEWIQMLPTYGKGVWTAYIDNQFYINANGERFVKEDARRDVLSKAILEQPKGEIFIISDANTVKDGMTINGREVDGGIGNGYVYKADTLEELAKQIEVPHENLKKSIVQFNDGVKSGTDIFGRKVFDKEFGVGPFYAGRTSPMVHHTMGGIKINERTQVIDAQGNIIPGLYAAGEVTGGIHGSNRLGGNAIPDAIVFGRIAGKTAAEIE